jgi:hypothetical protein
MTNHAEIMKALLDGKTIRDKDDHTLTFKLVDGLLCCFEKGEKIHAAYQVFCLSPQAFELCPDGQLVIETVVSTGRVSLFTAEVYKKLSEDKNSQWKCVLERIK